MINYFGSLINSLNIFDITFVVVMTYNLVQCFLKGFSLSFIAFMKWVISIVLTIILVPKLQPWMSEYIESEFVNSIGLTTFVFIISLFVIILIGKSVGRAVTWTGLGSIDKSFGLVFGLFKGYLVTVCIFTILNWFYPYKNWGISAEEASSFNIVKKGSDILLEEFPKTEDFIDTKEQIEKI